MNGKITWSSGVPADGGRLKELIPIAADVGSEEEDEVVVGVSPVDVKDGTLLERTNRDTNGGREKDWWGNIDGDVADDAVDEEVESPPAAPLLLLLPPVPNDIKRLGMSRLK